MLRRDKGSDRTGRAEDSSRGLGRKRDVRNMDTPRGKDRRNRVSPFKHTLTHNFLLYQGSMTGIFGSGFRVFDLVSSFLPILLRSFVDQSVRGGILLVLFLFFSRIHCRRSQKTVFVCLSSITPLRSDLEFKARLGRFFRMIGCTG